MTRYFASQLFDGYSLLNNMRFEVENGRITRLVSHASAEDAIPLDGLVMPAMVDIQVNGCGGVQFNDAPTVDTLKQMANAFLTTGTGSLMPTLITDDLAVMKQGADAIAQARQWDPIAIPGVHFEGPHLSTAKKGMHSNQYIRELGAEEFALFTRKDLGTVMVTVAPETVSTADIRRLTDAGVIVSVGHTNATAEACFAAFDAGASSATHLYNAMSPLTGREPGTVGAALYRNDIYCGLIVDHQHLHPVSATLAIRLKGDEKLMLITDAMAPAASDQDHFYYQGVKVLRQGPALKLEDGTLAGSVLTQQEAIQNTHFDLGFPLDSTLKMATATPAHFLGLSNTIGTLKEGAQANWLTLDKKLAITGTWRNGKLMS
ncbi:N-acetylglucosamine-6-phosphate deacetylase [Alteromonas sp. C1M14]|uniref:N-acetylglucosamine-6-phosphate deacetylase n=1 Tax=Alteromonas sp. C1M14 TaxID=2841567 RepID=UPI001C0A3032|nr:N-acetylglucosamine-6-phosphate deacetylase [Alteromonas sp. C1M14]MBU2979928.1 N-acetylglucosamine-6-phosphate deacetylase [Alteromonas sp. C1M14]